jgi:pimeloyl-ACP methyl ester carboxylesterase
MTPSRRTLYGIAASLGMLGGMHGANVACAEPESRSPTTSVVRSADKVPIAYDVRGTGSTALVFVHGWSCDRTYWAEQLPYFAERYTVVSLDLAGHGESGAGRKSWTIPSYGNDVAAVVKALRLKHVILIGHSMGGDVVTEAARHLKANTFGLIWLDTYKALGPGRSPESVDAIVDGLRQNFRESTQALVKGMFIPDSDPYLVENVVADMSSAPPEVALPSLHASLSYSREITKTLRELQIPVIAINADNAPTDTDSMGQYGVDVVVMQGVGHFMMLEAPRHFNAVLNAEIEQILQQSHKGTR